MMEAHPYYHHTTQREVKGVKEVQIYKAKLKTRIQSHAGQAWYILGYSS